MDFFELTLDGSAIFRGVSFPICDDDKVVHIPRVEFYVQLFFDKVIQIVEHGKLDVLRYVRAKANTDITREAVNNLFDKLARPVIAHTFADSCLSYIVPCAPEEALDVVCIRIDIIAVKTMRLFEHHLDTPDREVRSLASLSCRIVVNEAP